MLSPNYDRLTKVANLSFDDNDESRIDDALKQSGDALSEVVKYRQNIGMAGKTGEAILAWTAEFEELLGNRIGALTTLKGRYGRARKILADAREAYGRLSGQLLTAGESALASSSDPVTVDGVSRPAGEVMKELELERNAQREAEAKRILDQMNADLEQERLDIDKPVLLDPVAAPQDAAPLEAPVTAPTGAVPGLTPGPAAASGSRPGTSPVQAGILRPAPDLQPVPAEASEVPTGQLQGRPIMIPNGPAGGYVPPPVLNADHPGWSGSTMGLTPVPAGSSMVGGILSAGGAALAARAALGTSSAALAAKAAGGAAALRPVAAATRAPAGGMIRPAAAAAAQGGSARPSGARSGMRPGKPVPAAAAGAAANAGARAGGGAGRVAGGAKGASGGRVTGRPGSVVPAAGAAANAGARAGGGAGRVTGGAKGASGGRAVARPGSASAAAGAGTRPGGVGAQGAASSGTTGAGKGKAGAVAATGSSRDRKSEKKKAGLHGYIAETLEEDTPVENAGEALQAGSAESLRPIEDPDLGERW